jgi:hypothetical protein
MLGAIGVPELVVIAVLGALALLPIVAGIWGLVMLIRILSNQQAINARLDALERRNRSSDAGAGGADRR